MQGQSEPILGTHQIRNRAHDGAIRAETAGMIHVRGPCQHKKWRSYFKSDHDSSTSSKFWDRNSGTFISTFIKYANATVEY